VRLPWVKWYPANWSSEPGLRLCCAATRGIWAEALNTMMLRGSDRVEGTLQQLSRLCCCENDEMTTAVQQLSEQNVAQVNEQNGNISIINRRMARELEIKRLRSEAGKISATKRQLAKEQTAQHRSSSSSTSSSESVSKRRPSTQDELLRYAKTKGISESDAIAFWDSMEAGGWTRNGRPLKDWEAHLRSYKAQHFLASQKNGEKPKQGRDPYEPMSDKLWQLKHGNS
jgi:hypothetical protein